MAKLINIRVVTHPNGYDLSIGDEASYMYFTLAELVEGFMYHVGLDIVKFADEDTIHNLILACATYPKEGDAIQAVAKLEAENEALRQSHLRDKEAIRDTKERLARTAQELADTKAKLMRFISTIKPPKKEKPKVDKNITLAEAGVEKKKRTRKAKPKKEIVKVKPSAKPVDPELEKRLRAKGVLK